MSGVAACDAPTGTATVAVEAGSGENLIVVAPGANGRGRAGGRDGRRGARRHRSCCVQLEIPLDAVTAAVSHARGRVVLNPAPPPGELPAALLAQVDVLVPNEWELLRLAGVTSSDGSPEALAKLARRVTEGDVVVNAGRARRAHRAGIGRVDARRFPCGDGRRHDRGRRLLLRRVVRRAGRG